MLGVDEHRKKKFRKKVEKIQFHQRVHPSLILLSRIDEKKRLWKILRNHVWKLISGYERRQSFPLRHDNWFRDFPLFFQLNSTHLWAMWRKQNVRNIHSIHIDSCWIEKWQPLISLLWVEQTEQKIWWIFINFVAEKEAMKCSFINDVKWAFTVVGHWWKSDLSRNPKNTVIEFLNRMFSGLLMHRLIQLCKVFELNLNEYCVKRSLISKTKF